MCEWKAVVTSELTVYSLFSKDRATGLPVCSHHHTHTPTQCVLFAHTFFSFGKTFIHSLSSQPLTGVVLL